MTKGLNETELNLWKDCYLTKHKDGSYDECKITFPNVTNINSLWNLTKFGACPSRDWESTGGSNNEILLQQNLINETCKRGWDFDKSEFTRSLPMEQEWICDNKNYVADLYTYSIAGSIVGKIVFSYIADRFGRRITFWITTALICVSMTLKTFLSNYYYVYASLKVFAGACYISTYQLPAIIITEMSGPAYRTWVILVTWILW